MPSDYVHTYDALAEYVRTQLGRSDLRTLAEEERFYEHSVRVMNFWEGTSLSLSFPGPKTSITEDANRLDFRVDFQFKGTNLQLNHADLVVDLASKVIRGALKEEYAREILRCARDGQVTRPAYFIRKSIPSFLQRQYRSARLTCGMPETSRKLRPELTPEEMSAAIVFLLLRDGLLACEKIPHARQPALDRYAEALFVAIRSPNGFEEVIHRCLRDDLSHTRWVDCDYSFVTIPEHHSSRRVSTARARATRRQINTKESEQRSKQL